MEEKPKKVMMILSTTSSVSNCAEILKSQSAEFELHPEAMQYMFEMVAAPPLGPGLAGTLQVEKNLEERYDSPVYNFTGH